MNLGLRIRIVILLVTICLLIAMAADTMPKSRLVQTDYCVVTRRAAGKDELGNWHYFWAEGYGPCNQQDKFFDI